MWDLTRMGWLKSEHMFGKNDIMKLNLGSGKRNKVGYVNIDAIKHTDETIVGNILKLEYPNNSVDKILSSHVIEHLNKKEINTFFSECHRMLKINGELEIIAPCMLTIIKHFNNKTIDINYLDNFLYARHLHDYDYHKQGIYKEKLMLLCEINKLNVVEIKYGGNVIEPEIYLTAKK